MLGDGQVSRSRDRQEFGQSLDQAEEQSLEKWHVCAPFKEMNGFELSAISVNPVSWD